MLGDSRVSRGYRSEVRAVGGNKSKTLSTLSTMPAATGVATGLYGRLPGEPPKLPLALCLDKAYKAKAHQVED